MANRLSRRVWAALVAGVALVVLVAALVVTRGGTDSSSEGRTDGLPSPTTPTAPEPSTTSTALITTTLPPSTTASLPPTPQRSPTTTLPRPMTTAPPPTTSGKVGPNYSYSYSGDALVACNAEVTKLRSQGYNANSMESCVPSVGSSYYASLSNGTINVQIITETLTNSIRVGSTG